MTGEPPPQSQKKSLNPEERRQLRREYRNLTGSIENDTQMLVNGNSALLIDRLKANNDLFHKVTTTQDAVLDSQLLLRTLDITAQRTQKLKFGGGGFSIDEFIKSIRETVVPANGMVDFSVLNKQVKKTCLLVPTGSFMYGAINNEPKPKLPRKQSQKLVKDPKDLQKPEQVDNNDLPVDQNETSVNVQKIYTRLEEVEPLGVYEFFINPDSFGQSVENLFYLSFLVRDGRVSITEDPDTGKLMLETAEPPTIEQQQEEELVKHQNVLHLTMNIWKDLIGEYNIREPVIPHRESVIDGSGGAWR